MSKFRDWLKHQVLLTFKHLKLRFDYTSIIFHVLATDYPDRSFLVIHCFCSLKISLKKKKKKQRKTCLHKVEESASVHGTSHSTSHL